LRAAALGFSYGNGGQSEFVDHAPGRACIGAARGQHPISQLTLLFFC
jgi:hypothetical protein